MRRRNLPERRHCDGGALPVRFEEILPAVKAGQKARRAAWDAPNDAWLELVPAHPLPDGRTVAEMLLVGHDGGQPLREFGRTSYDLAEADDWELLPAAK